MTDDQRGDFHTRVDSILDSMKIPLEAYQGFHGGGRTFEFGGRLKALVQEFILDPTNPYADEKTKPDASWNYSLTGLLTASEQAASVHQKLGFQGTYEVKLVEYPEDGRADGVIVIPFLRDLGTAFGVPDPTGDGYGKVGENVWERVSTDRKGKVDNYRKRQLGSNYVRLNADARALLEAIEAKVPAEKGVIYYHAIPTNTGSLFAGYSPRNARLSSLQQDILPLGFVQVLCIMLAWPQRLSKYNVRWIDCPADEYNWEAVGAWAYCPCVYFYDGKLGLNAGGAGYARGYYGCAVAFPGVTGNSNLGNSE
jgi:hypothetical protein